MYSIVYTLPLFFLSRKWALNSYNFPSFYISVFFKKIEPQIFYNFAAASRNWATVSSLMMFLSSSGLMRSGSSLVLAGTFNRIPTKHCNWTYKLFFHETFRNYNSKFKYIFQSHNDWKFRLKLQIFLRWKWNFFINIFGLPFTGFNLLLGLLTWWDPITALLLSLLKMSAQLAKVCFQTVNRKNIYAVKNSFFH